MVDGRVRRVLAVDGRPLDLASRWSMVGWCPGSGCEKPVGNGAETGRRGRSADTLAPLERGLGGPRQDRLAIVFLLTAGFHGRQILKIAVCTTVGQSMVADGRWAWAGGRG